MSAAERRPADLVFVVDVSGSMAREDRLGLVKRSLAMLLDELRPADRVALVIYGSRGEVVLPFTSDKSTIGLGGRPSGARGGDQRGGGAGARLPAGRADRGGADAIRRIVLCSDGVANVGRTGPDSILAQIGAAAAPRGSS